MDQVPAFQSARILAVDDSPLNVIVIEALLEKWGYTHVTTTTKSHKLLELCSHCPPDLILLDLQMPAPDGFELLGRIRNWGDGKPHLPILVLTAEDDPQAMERALSLGASDVVTKPFNESEVRLRIANLLAVRRLTLDQRDQNAALERRVRERTRDLDLARLETLERLALAAEFRDDDTHEHAQRVGRTCAMIATELGMTADEVELLRRAAPLHDIGKVGISDAVLLKPGRLTPADYDQMKAHTVLGREILSGSESPILRLSETIAMTHHERWDGSGYPFGRRETDIPLVGRVVAVADVFDALTHERPYKQAFPLDVALGEIRRAAGTHFDPNLVELFQELDHEALLAPVEAG